MVNRVNHSLLFDMLSRLSLLLLSAAAVAPSATAAAPFSHGEFLAEVREKCLGCHGKSQGNNQRIEGDFDLTDLLEKGELSLVDSAVWLRVWKEVEAGRMPPDERLEQSRRVAWKSTLDSALHHRGLPPRMLTAVEIDNDHAQLYGYDQLRYAPFDALKLQRISDARYRTIRSAQLMSGDFLGDLQLALSKVIHDYTSDRHEVTKKGLPAGETSPVEIAVEGDLQSAVSLIESGKRSTDVDLRIWEPTRLFFRGLHPGRGVSPGHYRISFKARMVGRHLIAEKKKELEQSTRGRDQNAMRMLMETWEELYHSKAILALQIGNHEDRKNPTVRKIAEFEIGDDELREYSHDFVLKTSTFPYFCFENGPCENRWTQVKFGRERVGKSKDYRWPSLRLREMAITKIAEAKARNPYDIAYLQEGEFDEREAIRRLREYAKQLAAPGSLELAVKLYQQLPENFDTGQRYRETLKLLSMSQNYLALSSTGTVENAGRYASYAFLKHKPTTKFQREFLAFRDGKLSADTFAKSLIEAPAFELFLKEFINGWFGTQVDLDIEKYDKHSRALDLNRESVDYLKHVFAQNRPLAEVFQSDYKVLNSTLAPYYQVSDAKSGTPQVFEGQPGGILQQMAFLKSQSDGIDGLPFRRSKWVLENVFNERLGDPPNSVDNDEFVSSIEVTTFKERTELHSKQTGCYHCHEAIDPVAFAFQHLDPLGERIADLELEYVRQFHARLANSKAEQVRAFAKQLLQYITGRETTLYDHHVIEVFLKRNGRAGYRSRALISHILTSYFDSERDVRSHEKPKN